MEDTRESFRDDGMGLTNSLSDDLDLQGMKHNNDWNALWFLIFSSLYFVVWSYSVRSEYFFSTLFANKEVSCSNLLWLRASDQSMLHNKMPRWSKPDSFALLRRCFALHDPVTLRLGTGTGYHP